MTINEEAEQYYKFFKDYNKLTPYNKEKVKLFLKQHYMAEDLRELNNKIEEINKKE